MVQRSFGEFYSWSIIREDVAIKKSDLSFFKYRGSGIPKEIKWFFNCEDLLPGDTIDIDLDFLGRRYSGRIQCDPFERCRIFWDPNLSYEFELNRKDCNGRPFVRFQKTAPNHYCIEFLDRV